MRRQRTEDRRQQSADTKQCEEDQARESETRAPFGDAWLAVLPNPEYGSLPFLLPTYAMETISVGESSC